MQKHFFKKYDIVSLLENSKTQILNNCITEKKSWVCLVNLPVYIIIIYWYGL